MCDWQSQLVVEKVSCLRKYMHRLDMKASKCLFNLKVETQRILSNFEFLKNHFTNLNTK